MNVKQMIDLAYSSVPDEELLDKYDLVIQDQHGNHYTVDRLSVTNSLQDSPHEKPVKSLTIEFNLF